MNYYPLACERSWLIGVSDIAGTDSYVAHKSCEMSLGLAPIDSWMNQLRLVVLVA